jgi:Zn-dependent M16 (insulinase) family peptidase
MPKQDEKIFEFRILRTWEMDEYRSRVTHCLHEKSGCELLHMGNEDPENLFSFNFRTPPPDNSGLTHILEHSVLGGSRRFPLKDPFVLLLKSSLNTFLNAMTFPDRTLYPASSTVEKDFYNLMEVYGDAVFFPLLKREVFMQEGHHLEFLDPGDEQSGLKHVGVVYNEMRGAFSSPETLVADWSVRSLFPDTPYGLESGGDPRHIPSLGYDSFRAYHRRYYHPSNCRIFIYGNIPLRHHLRFLNEKFLSGFSRADSDSALPLQPRWQQPRILAKSFPAAEAEGKQRATVTVNWLTAPVTDPRLLLALEVLGEVLVGNAGAPLQRALVESGLGEDISPASGLDSELKEAVFTVGLRGTADRHSGEIEGLVLSTLKKLRDRGLQERLVEGAVQRILFRNRELRRGGRPYALRLLRRTLRGWIHDSEPTATLAFRPVMEVFRRELAEKPAYLADVIDSQLLANPHRTRVLIAPDAGQAAREDAERRSALESLSRSLSSHQREEIRLDNRALREFQQRPDNGSNKVPSLRLADLPGRVQTIPNRPAMPAPGPREAYAHELFSAGVIYLDLAIDVSGIPAELSRLLPLFGRAVCGSGLPGVPYTRVAGDLALVTGGFRSGLSAHTALCGETRQFLFFRVKMLEEKLPAAVELVWDLLLRADLGDVDRLRIILAELKNDLKSSLIPAGHHYAVLRAGSRLSAALAVEESWKGVSQLLALEELSASEQGQPAALTARLEELRQKIVTSSRMVVNMTGEGSALAAIEQLLTPRIAALDVGQRTPEAAALPAREPGGPAAEALLTEAGVGYVAHSFRGSRYGSPENAADGVLSHLLSTGYLWEHVRQAGGAYSAFASPDGLESLFTLASYRDPHIGPTLKAFRSALAHAAADGIDAHEAEQAVIGTVGKEIAPLDPGEKGIVSLRRNLYGITDELRQQHREALLRVGRAELARRAEALLETFDRGVTVVLTGKSELPRAKEAVKDIAVLELPG